MLSFLLSIIYHVDLFKTPFLLRFKHRKQSSTYLGSILSLLIFSAVLVSFFQSDVIHKRNPKVIEKVVSTYSAQTPGSPSVMVDANFSYVPFSFGVTDLNRNLIEDPTVFTLEAYYKVQRGSNFTQYPINARPCTTQESTLKGFNLSRSHCVPWGNDFLIQGGPQEDIFYTLIFALRICNSQTDNVTCKNASAIQAFMVDKYFYVFFADHTYDVENYEHPINDEYGFKKTRVSLLQSTFVGTFYQKTIFQSDDNPIVNSITEKVFFTKYADEIDTQPLQGTQFMYMNTENRYLVAYYFGTSPSIHTITRTYQKLQEALANVAGISNFLIFIGFIITGFQSRLNMVSKIVKILFVLQKKKKQDSIIRRNSKNQDNTRFNKSPVEENRNNVLISLEQFSPKNTEPFKVPVSADRLNPEELKVSISPTKKKEILDEISVETPVISRRIDSTTPLQINKNQTDSPQIQRSIDKDESWMVSPSKNVLMSENAIDKSDVERINQKSMKFQKYCKRNYKLKELNITTYRYLKAQLRKALKASLNDNEKSIIMAEEIYNEEIDIVTILLKLQEIEKLKKILLSEEQLVLFNLLDKPKIYPELKSRKEFWRDSITFDHAKSPSKKYEETLKDNAKIYEKMIGKKEKNKMERRLLELLEKDIEEFDQG